MRPEASGQAEAQLNHLRWHGDTLHHWHVGVTAPRLTEDVKEYFGVPVYRLLDMGRNDIRAVGSHTSSCHWPKESPDWPERGDTIA